MATACVSRQLYLSSFRDCYLGQAICASYSCCRPASLNHPTGRYGDGTATRSYRLNKWRSKCCSVAAGIYTCGCGVQNLSPGRYASCLSPIQGSQKYSKYTGQALAGLSAKSHSLPLIPNAQSVFSSTHILYSFKSNVPFLASCNKFYITQVNSVLLKRSFHSGSLLSDPKDERKILLDEKSKIEEFVDHQRKKRENAKDDTGNIQDQVKDAFIFRADAGAAPAIKEAKVAIPEKPKKPILQRIKDEVIHYYKGFRLLFLDVRVATRMLWQVLNGKTLSRRERKQFLRTVADLFKLVPFMVFLIIPFMEFLLPVALWLFPGMLPSTFEDKAKKEETRKKSLKLKIQMAKFLQDTVEEIAVSATTKKSQEKLKEFADFVQRIRSEGEQPSNDEIIKYAKIFEDEITLENLSQAQLKAVCRLLMIPSVGTSNYLRFILKMKLRELKADDKLIKKEGIDNLSNVELQQANVARGMRALGVPEERLKSQLKQWLELSLDEEVPGTLLLLSRALYIPAHLSSTEQLKVTLSQLPERLVDEAEVKVGAIEGEEVDRQTMIDIIEHEEERIKEERAQEEAEEALKKKLREQEAAELLKEPDETVGDLSEDLLRLKETITTVKDELEQVKEDREEYREDLKELAAEVIDKEVVESAASSRLGKQVDHLIEEIDEELVKVEQGEDKLDKDQDGIITTQELFEAIRTSKDAPTEDKARKICELLDMDKDGALDLDELKKAVELIEKEDLDVNDEQVAEVMKLIKQSEDILVIEQIFAKQKSNLILKFICDSCKKKDCPNRVM